MKTIKVRIFEKNEGFVNDLINFLMKNSYEFSKTIKRDNLINEILSIDKKLKKDDLSVFTLRDLSPIKIGITESEFDRCGKNYEFPNEDILNISKITHSLQYITVESRDEFYGTIKILDTPQGKPLKSLEEEDIILKPIYNRDNKIVRFDIDININNAA
jgi:hypothetical protein